MAIQSPFALFVLAADVDTEYINYCLRRAWRGNFMAAWDFWVATDNYNDLPKKRNDTDAPQGTIAPIHGSYMSPWVGKALRDCARWLHKAPADAAVNREYFTAMNEHSKSDDMVLVCRIIPAATSGDVDVEYFPLPTDVVAMHMVTNSDTKFNEKAVLYRRSGLRGGKLR